MLPVGLTAKTIQLCTAVFGVTINPLSAAYAITLHTGVTLSREAVAAHLGKKVRDYIPLGDDCRARLLQIAGRDFATCCVTPTSVFVACALAHIDNRKSAAVSRSVPSVSNVAALVHLAFGARITDTIRPINASYGARYSWHKYGQAVDFVPAGGVNSINRDQIRELMGQSGIRLIELLGPGDRGHSNHWHIAFARPGQVIDRTRLIEEDEDWIVNVAQADVPSPTTPLDPEAPPAPASALVSAVKAPPGWDVFGREEWRAAHGGDS